MPAALDTSRSRFHQISTSRCAGFDGSRQSTTRVNRLTPIVARHRLGAAARLPLGLAGGQAIQHFIPRKVARNCFPRYLIAHFVNCPISIIIGLAVGVGINVGTQGVTGDDAMARSARAGKSDRLEQGHRRIVFAGDPITFGKGEKHEPAALLQRAAG
jgi:hypothetical protein